MDKKILDKENVIKCCPKCGATITVSELFEYSHNYKILKSGRISKRFTVKDDGPLECMIACCSNNCGAIWDADEFYINEKNQFVDEKYNSANDIDT